MPSKKKGPSEQKSKKAIAEAKRIRAADQTFGIKNKGKSAKAKQYVSRVEHSLTGNEKKAQQERKEKLKAKREQREAERARGIRSPNVEPPCRSGRHQRLGRKAR